MTSTTTPTSQVEHGLRIAGPITTDAKVIPTIVARRAPPATGLVEAFRRTVAAFEGSVAIGAAAADDPERIFLALRGSGQGAVRRPRRRLLHRRQRAVRRRRGDRSRVTSRLDGEHGGQVVVLDGRRGRRARRHRPSRLRRHAAAGDGGRGGHGRGDDARHRPRRLAALPAEGDQRGARELRARRCAARSSSATGCCTPSSAPVPCRRRSPPASPTARSARSA